MNFFGLDFVGQVRSNATHGEPFYFVQLMNAVFNSIYFTNDMEKGYHTMPNPWTYDTILYCDFLESLHAGNVEYTADQVSHILVKRRIKGTFDWTSVFKVNIHSVEDFTFERFDYLNQAKVLYEYAFVPLINNVEGEFNFNTVYSEFDGIYLVNREYVYKAIADVEISNIDRVQPNATVSAIGRKYPYVMSNGTTNYETGALSGLFTSFDVCSNTIDGYTEEQYRKAFFDFLTDGKPKILKDSHSRMWLIMIVDTPSYSAISGVASPMGYSQMTWVEVGDYNSSEDLYNNDLTNILEENT